MRVSDGGSNETPTMRLLHCRRRRTIIYRREKVSAGWSFARFWQPSNLFLSLRVLCRSTPIVVKTAASSLSANKNLAMHLSPAAQNARRKPCARSISRWGLSSKARGSMRPTTALPAAAGEARAASPAKGSRSRLRMKAPKERAAARAASHRRTSFFPYFGS